MLKRAHIDDVLFHVTCWHALLNDELQNTLAASDFVFLVHGNERCFIGDDGMVGYVFHRFTSLVILVQDVVHIGRVLNHATAQPDTHSVPAAQNGRRVLSVGKNQRHDLAYILSGHALRATVCALYTLAQPVHIIILHVNGYGQGCGNGGRIP